MTTSTRRIGLVTIAVFLLTACSASGQVDGCQPSVTESNPRTTGEVQASTDGGMEAWALVFRNWEAPNGAPLTLPARTQIKIVWRATGKGGASFNAIGPDDQTIQPDWGPDPHGGSNWDRPGLEWGSGWTFPTTGCWAMQLHHGGQTATLTALVEEPSSFSFLVPSSSNG